MAQTHDNLKMVDPDWAWSTFEPTEDRPWNRKLAAHLYRRAGFGASWSELETATQDSPAEVVRQLLQPGPGAARAEMELASFDEMVLAAGNVEGLPAWWLYRMLHAGDPLLEKLTLFWHGHFATSAAKVDDTRLMFTQHQLFRKHARGQFGDLVHALSRDPAMLEYLDSATNRKTHPNENYARELMELFCLGTGNYTEQDIQELARAFTGWEVHRKKFIYNDYEHDRGRKTILGQTGNFGGEQGIEIVLSHEATPRFIAGKLFNFFVRDEPQHSAVLIEPLARQLRESDFDVAEVVGTILNSQLFFSDYAVGCKVRSPIDVGLGIMRALRSSGNMNNLARRLGELGQLVFYPPNVKGWDGGRAWINSSTLLGRANLARDIIYSADLPAVTKDAGVETPNQIVDWAFEMLVAVPVPEAVRHSLLQLATRKQDDQARIADVLHAVSALPEFQLN